MLCFIRSLSARTPARIPQAEFCGVLHHAVVTINKRVVTQGDNPFIYGGEGEIRNTNFSLFSVPYECFDRILGHFDTNF